MCHTQTGNLGLGVSVRLPSTPLAVDRLHSFSIVCGLASLLMQSKNVENEFDHDSMLTYINTCVQAEILLPFPETSGPSTSVRETTNVRQWQLNYTLHKKAGTRFKLPAIANDAGTSLQNRTRERKYKQSKALTTTYETKVNAMRTKTGKLNVNAQVDRRFKEAERKDQRSRRFPSYSFEESGSSQNETTTTSSNEANLDWDAEVPEWQHEAAEHAVIFCSF